ncbi:hypothetical protein LBMAG53_38280 [Planctomycetota bacterium]|nr:hypothetical protein LBMAG53_38280 [Planctomycetota bacterium]
MLLSPLPAAERGDKPFSVEDAAGVELVRFGRSRALVIGNSAYRGLGYGKLPGVDADVEAVAKALGEAGFAVTTRKDLDGRALRDAFEVFTTKDGSLPDARLVVYYAGHGETRTHAATGRAVGYLVPVDCPSPARDQSAFIERALPMEQVQTWAGRMEAQHVLFVLDACFSGTIFKARSNDDKVPPTITRALAKPVRQFLTAGDAGQTVPDESIFRRYFVRGIQGEADLSRDGWVTATELGMFVKDHVTNETKKAQTPVDGKIMDVALNEGEFVFKVPGTATPVKVPGTTESGGNQNVPKPATFDIRDLDSVNFQKAMAEAFVVAESRHGDDKLPAAAKREIWQRFLGTFKDDDPLSTEDERLRGLATDRLQSLRDGPPWASASGQDEYGKWADLKIGDVVTRLRLIKAGRFTMGSPVDEPERSPDEAQHRVTISRGFWLGESAVTQALWQQIMGKNPAYFTDDANRAVDTVSWQDCQEFFTKLNGQLRGVAFTFPTEAQWEYACRAGSTTPFNFATKYDTERNTYCLKKDNNEESWRLNAWGLKDMHTGIGEWCADWYGEYPSGPCSNPTGPSSGVDRVRRGASKGFLEAFYEDRLRSRSAHRDGSAPGIRRLDTGVRMATPDLDQGATTLPLEPEGGKVAQPMKKTVGSTMNETVWPSATGTDQYGAWADLKVGRVTQRMRLIKAGTFQMGSPKEQLRRTNDKGDYIDEIGGEKDEIPHLVTLTKDYWLADSEVTQEMWREVMGYDHSKWRNSDSNPADSVFWFECREFFVKLNGKVGGGAFSFPTEAQWEYACRAGTTTPFSFGAKITRDKQVVFDIMVEDRDPTVPVRSRQPNVFGLYEMHGNVREWCADRYGRYPTDPVFDPTGPEATTQKATHDDHGDAWNLAQDEIFGANRVIRGGGWCDHATDCRSAKRLKGEDISERATGFRISAPIKSTR